MQIEITPEEVEIMMKALDCWEKQPQADGMIGSIFTALLLPKDGDRNESQRLDDQLRNKSEMEVRLRKISSVTLQAKLIKAVSESRSTAPFGA